MSMPNVFNGWNPGSQIWSPQKQKEPNHLNYHLHSPTVSLSRKQSQRSELKIEPWYSNMWCGILTKIPNVSSWYVTINIYAQSIKCLAFMSVCSNLIIPLCINWNLILSLVTHIYFAILLICNTILNSKTELCFSQTWQHQSK